jgi:hypothetical protein
LAAVFVIAAKDAPQTILSYYTLSSRELRLEQLLASPGNPASMDISV